MKYFKKIQGERIYLSPVNPDDAEQYTAWINDPAVSDGLGSTADVFSLRKERAFLEKAADSEGYYFAIVRLADDKLLGSVSFHDISEISRNADCGLFIGDAEDRGKGYGAEALRLLLGFGFRTLNLNNVMLKCFSYNAQAIACYKKVGFRVIGERRRACFINGQYHGDVFMDILAEEFFEKYGGAAPCGK